MYDWISLLETILEQLLYPWHKKRQQTQEMSLSVKEVYIIVATGPRKRLLMKEASKG